MYLALRFILQRNVRIADWIYCNSTAEDDIGDTEESFRRYLAEKIATKRIASCLFSLICSFDYRILRLVFPQVLIKQVNN